MASKQVRKITSITADELVKVDMADRDGDGKKIKDTYATKSALTTAQNSADSGISTNSAAIAALGTRVTAAEGSISANTTAISTEASTRATAVSDEATARANADTALGGRIDTLTGQLQSEVTARTNSVSTLTKIAHGATRTFVLSVYHVVNGDRVADEFNSIFNVETDAVEAVYADDYTLVTLLHNVTCPVGTLPDEYVTLHGNVAEWLVFVPPGMSASDIEDIATAANKVQSNVQIVTINVGDVLLIRDTAIPDRWLSGSNANGGTGDKLYFSKLETTKVDLSSYETAVTGLQTNVESLQSTVGGHTTSITNLQTTVAGKQNALTFDTTPTTGSSNPVTSGGVKTALDNMQSSLNLQSSVIGSVTISD